MLEILMFTQNTQYAFATLILLIFYLPAKWTLNNRNNSTREEDKRGGRDVLPNRKGKLSTGAASVSATVYGTGCGHV